ncbi:NAD-dependent epimerase/dehydratase family protein [Cytophagales bacterium LB-30]|uniref:NAD-dependent epimerase/dehydratase family protein n=1 Tax=Shiella aurantiaca TaxID=3058365 RepID=A0ABT8F8B1_9BACT|nr:NAD-dependent epimerase/dehydratase family protein [Shiella aurantiaca]MDN4166610.1 NAD-dependent epimerase/dehydratase family protein [Shiella aurantiaca]
MKNIKADIILITGIAGFIGFHQALRMKKVGYKVVGIDNLNDYYDPQLKLARLRELGITVVEEEGFTTNSDQSIIFYKGDIQDAALLEQIYQTHPFQGIIHLAAQAGVRYSVENPHAYVDTNIKGFLNILELARAHTMEHVVYASSSSVYGMQAAQPFSENDPCNHPVSLYAATKKANEMMAECYHHLYKIPLTGLRFFTVYGPWGRPDMAPMLFAQAIIEGRPIKVFNHGKQKRDFTYIDDICEGVAQVYESERLRGQHDILNIGNGAPVNLLDFIETLEHALGKAVEKVFCDAQPGDVEETYANTNNLDKYISFKTKVKISDGIHHFTNWFKSY